MKWSSAVLAVLAALLPTLFAATPAPRFAQRPAQRPAPVAWRLLQPGVEFTAIDAPRGPLHVVRVDPRRAKLAAGLASQTDRAATAAEWCRTERFAVAINLGMFDPDHRTHTGYLRDGAHVNNPDVNDYRSVLALRPTKPGVAAAHWFDLASPMLPSGVEPYRIVVQNLRLIGAGRQNVWTPSDRRWSEAALAIDSKGRLLFLFTRAPYAMRELNALLLRLPLDVQRAMHLEGGPEASLSIHANGVDLDLCGSFETGFVEDDSNRAQWPLPNVLGVLREP